MTYSAPTIGSSGLAIPSYNDILQYFISETQNIYGSDIYLGTDSADYQLLSIIALLASDCMNMGQLAYNSFRVAEATGVPQDSLYKLNGIKRLAASYSTCQVTLSGTAGTVITNGKVQDSAGNYWYLPSTVTLDSTGAATVTAVCETIGAITALAGDLSIIATPTYGWTSVTNTSPAAAGTTQETDSAFRGRQATSTELPSQTILAGTIAGIAATTGVTRYLILENPTSVTDSNGLPPHSISAVVEGGADSDVAQTIYNNRGLGCLTNGSTTVDITDTTYGSITPISFYRPTYVPIYVTLGIHSLTGYTTSTTTAIQTAVTNYLNSLQIFEELTISGIYAAAMSVNSNISRPLFSIKSLTAGTSSGVQGTTDISVLFNQVTQGISSNVVINLV